MSKNSVLQNCMTPKEELPRQLILSTGVIAWLVLILAWVLLAASDIVPDMFLPSPIQVFEAGVRLAENGTLMTHVWSSFQVVIIGFLISSVVAVPVGLMMGSFRIVQAFLEPLVNFIRYLPVTSFVPLFMSLSLFLSVFGSLCRCCFLHLFSHVFIY